MRTREEVLNYGLSFDDVYMDAPFRDDNWIFLSHKDNRKAFLCSYEYEGQMRINVKVDPEKRELWRSAYESVIPGYHQNKEHWNTIILDGSVPDKDIKMMIGDSYDLTLSSKK